MREIRHIFFDLDHTLWDFETNSDAAYRRVLEKYGIPLDFDTFGRIYHPINRQCWDDYAAGKVTKEQVKYNRLRRTLDAAGISTDDETVRRMADEYLEYLSQGTAVFDGAFEVLERLKEKYRLHLLTNGFAEVQLPKIRHTGLEDYFATITLSEETGQLKPHPKVFRHALRKAGARAHRSLMIGDNFRSDITGALNVGMRAILFDPDGRYDVPPVVAPTVTRLTEILRYL